MKKILFLITIMIMSVALTGCNFKKASPVIAVNCGPGTFGILTMDAERG